MSRKIECPVYKPKAVNRRK